ncbi:MAG: PAS domain S-box protein [Vicinamibacterales bacterium]
MSATLSPHVVAVLDLLQDAALLVDRSGHIAFANRNSAALLGHAHDALIGMPVEALVAPEFREEHARLRSNAMASGRARPMGSGLAIQACRADGTTLPVDISLSPFGPEPALFMLACIRDMSEHARLIREVRSAEERYRMVVTSASEVFYRVAMSDNSLRGQVEFVSPQCERITGITPAEFIANSGLWLECVHPDDRPVLFATTQEILQTGQEGSRSYRLRHVRTGEYRWVADRVVPLHDASGRVCGYQGVARDVTEQRRAEQAKRSLEEELRQAQKMEAIGRLAGNVAHDFNNLITVILASSDHARVQLAPASPVMDTIDEIIDAGERATELTRRLLTLTPDQPRAPHLLDVTQHLQECASLIRRMLPPAIDLQWSLADGLWPAHLDPGQLDQVVFNLVGNARDAMPDGGVLTIRTSNTTAGGDGLPLGGPTAFVQLDVVDTGAGMDEATAARVFEPFFTTKPEGKGTGLGLASVYAIVRQSGGDIHIDTAPGRGTRVTVRFPRAVADA